MKQVDFHVGLKFVGSGGFWWRCTDVGTRTIVAIHLDQNDPNWYQGPPYIAKEVVFDEVEIEACHLTIEDGIVAALDEFKTSGHPGYPSEAVRRMLGAQITHRSYPHKGVLRFDRCRSDGEILHPYAGHKEGETNLVELYLPFQNAYDVMAERDFIALPRASAEHIRARAQKSGSTGVANQP
jgi:hypothetical protein